MFPYCCGSRPTIVFGSKIILKYTIYFHGYGFFPPGVILTVQKGIKYYDNLLLGYFDFKPMTQYCLICIFCVDIQNCTGKVLVPIIVLRMNNLYCFNKIQHINTIYRVKRQDFMFISRPKSYLKIRIRIMTLQTKLKNLKVIGNKIH